MNPKHICIAAGGTGGHFYPAMAVAAACRKRGHRVTMAVAGQHTEEHVAAAQQAGLEAVTMPALRLPRLASLGLLLFPWRFWRCWRQAVATLRRLQPDVVLGMGSFASVPTGLAAGSAGMPLVLHEGNAIIGKANRFLSRRAVIMATSLPLQPGQACGCPHQITGLPLRPALLEAAASRSETDVATYLKELGLDPALPVLLVFGGSQGARAVNQVVADTALHAAALATRFQVLQFTGQEDNRELEAAYAKAGVRCAVRKAETRMHLAYHAAGLVLCRAGASTISELALFGKPAILIPLPTAADDHQTANAVMVAARTAGEHLPQAAATPERLQQRLQAWLDTPASFAGYANQIRALAAPTAAEAIADVLEKAVASK